MLVSAGLTFVLMHGEMKAETSDKELEVYCELALPEPRWVRYCKIKDLTCVFNRRGLSCVRG